jgi:hypothetical protein
MTTIGELTGFHPAATLAAASTDDLQARRAALLTERQRPATVDRELEAVDLELQRRAERAVRATQATEDLIAELDRTDQAWRAFLDTLPVPQHGRAFLSDVPTNVAPTTAELVEKGSVLQLQAAALRQDVYRLLLDQGDKARARQVAPRPWIGARAWPLEWQPLVERRFHPYGRRPVMPRPWAALLAIARGEA